MTIEVQRSEIAEIERLDRINSDQTHELDYLRAENTALREMLQSAREAIGHLTEALEEMAKRMEQ